MPLSWNEIKDRALAFAREYAEDTAEDAEAKTFWEESAYRGGPSYKADAARGENRPSRRYGVCPGWTPALRAAYLEAIR
jgi:hypothetical protein